MVDDWEVISLRARGTRLFVLLLVAQWGFALVLAFFVQPLIAIGFGLVLMMSSLTLRRLHAGEARLMTAREHRSVAIIERKVQERTLELQDGLERYRSLVENTEAVQFECDVVAWQLLYVAPQAARLLDCTPAELEDRTFLATIIHPEDRAAVRVAIERSVCGVRGASEPIDCRLITRSQRVVFVRCFVRSEGSRRLRGIMIDVTRQHQVESERQRSQNLESVGRLAAGVAHEINTPIQYVGNSIEFVRDALADMSEVIRIQRDVINSGIDGASMARACEVELETTGTDLPYVMDELPRALDRIDDGIGRVAKIVRSMTVFARPDTTEMVDVDLNQVVESTLTLAASEYCGVADLETDFGEMPWLRCHAGEINQVILNIVINAAHAIGDVVKQTGDRGKISVITRGDEDRVAIWITDTGSGIPEDVCGRVFDPFFTTKQLGKGTGQGLAIARSVIVEKYRGSLTFETFVGKGTTFRVSIPRQSMAA